MMHHHFSSSFFSKASPSYRAFSFETFLFGTFLFVSALFVSLFCTANVFAFSGEKSVELQLLEEKNIFDLDDEEKIFYEDVSISRENCLKWSMRNAGFSVKNYKSENTHFSDISKEDELSPFVSAAISFGALDFLDQQNIFLPKRKISRLEGMKILFAIEGISTFQKYQKRSTPPFNDLPENPRDKAIILKAVELGYLHETSPTTISPKKKLKQQDLILILAEINKQKSSKKQLEKKSKEKTLLEISEEIILNNSLQRKNISSEILKEQALNGMLDTLNDPYSVYMPPENAKAFTDFINGEEKEYKQYAGIGVAIIQSKTGGLIITEVFDGGPAKKVGFLVGDEIVQVNSKDITNLSTSEIIAQIKGESGSSVTITYIRNHQVYTKKVQRGLVDVTHYTNLETQKKDGIVWIKVRSFQSNTGSEFASALKENISPNTKGLIVDLRYNPGGLMSSAQQMLGELLPENSITTKMNNESSVTTQTVNTIGTTDSTKNTETEDYKNSENSEKQETQENQEKQKAINEKILKTVLVSGSGNFTKIPLVVFQNEHSASASEIFSGSIKDYKRGKIIGKTSFGKGIAQKLYPLSNGGTIKLTTNEFFTPLGNTVHKSGIEPDITTDRVDDQTLFRIAKQYLK